MHITSLSLQTGCLFVNLQYRTVVVVIADERDHYMRSRV